LRLSTLLEAAGRTDDALKRLDQALSRQGLTKEQQRSAYRQRGVILEKSGHPAKAARDFERAMVLGDGSPSMYLGLAQLYQAADEPEKAGEFFAKVLNSTGASRSDVCSARDGLGMLYLSRGSIPEAIPQLSGALTQCGETWQRHYYLGIAYYRDRQWQPAMDQLQRADERKGAAADIIQITVHQLPGGEFAGNRGREYAPLNRKNRVVVQQHLLAGYFLIGRSWHHGPYSASCIKYCNLNYDHDFQA